MSCNLKPRRKDLIPVTRGDTYPAINFTASGTENALSSVAMSVYIAGGTSPALTLSNGSGITITDATAGSWAFTIDEMTPATTEALTAGIYFYDIQTVDSAGVKKTRLAGSWAILTQVTPN
jgi:hypothetical protein